MPQQKFGSPLSRLAANLYKVRRRIVDQADRATRMRGGFELIGDGLVQALLNPLLTLFAALAVPAIVLVGALWLEDTAARLSAAQLQLLAWFPLVVFAIGIGLAARFNRLRLLAALVNLLLAYAALVWLLPALDAFEARTLLGFLFLLLPLNHLASHALPEHTTGKGLRYYLLGALGIEALCVVTVAGTEWQGAVALLWANPFGFIDTADLRLSDLGFTMAAVLLALSFARLYTLTTTQRAGLFVSAYCLVLLLANHQHTGTLIAFAAAGALVLAIAAFQESWNIAYLDQLTELPGRRALDEALARLEGSFAVAMLDVDHFKKFNDTHGHDVGDQVLRMVASQLRDVGGGGRAYRYGGEEFTLLFPGRSAEEALPAVDAVRAAIAKDTFEIRRHDRRGAGEQGAASPAGGIRITVSAGVAERRGRAEPPADIIKAADEALYAAKRAGRNRVVKQEA